MPELYKTFEIPDELNDDVQADDEVTYPSAPLWDFEAGDFVQSGGRIAMVDGYRAWVQWCVKAVITERATYLVYTDEHGTDLEELSQLATRDEVESQITDTITDALLIDPRTSSVTGFTFEWEGDECRVGFTVEPTIGTTERVEVAIKA